MAGLSIFGRRISAGNILGLAIAAAVSAAGQSALAQVQPTGFQLDVSPSARILDALDMNRDGQISSSQYYDVKYDESCDNPHLRIRARNKPAFMVTNNATSAGALTTLSIEINNGGAWTFGMGDVAADNFTSFIKNTMYTDDGVSITGSSVSADQKTLTVNFDGLTAGKKAIFHLDLDPTDPNDFMYPDYRMVLFGAPHDGGAESTPATAVATFATAAPNTANINFTQVDDEPDFMNANIRPYVAPDKMEVFKMGGAIPEPNSAVLALAGWAMLAARRRRVR
jgi:hypothetical protein